MTVPETVPERVGAEEVSKSTSEVHITADEETPLLSSSGPTRHGSSSRTNINSNPNSNSDEEAPLLRETSNDEDDQPEEHLEEKKRRTAGWYIWRAVVLIVTVFLATIFIKGWIDGDVDFGKALQSAFRGGISGAAAMFLQVLLLMPLRTIMNYQYRYGSSFTAATKTLYRDGGYGRYYQGLGAALFQGPLARFGDTAANAGILAILASNAYLKDSPKWFQTIFVSFCGEKKGEKTKEKERKRKRKR